MSEFDLKQAESLLQSNNPVDQGRSTDLLANLLNDENGQAAGMAASGLYRLGRIQIVEHFLAQLTLEQRMAWGRHIGNYDSRPGVGLRENGLPDIDWVEIPQGEFIYQDGEKLTLPTYYISRYPITYVQFQTFIDANDGFRKWRWWRGLTYDFYRYQNQQHPGKQAFKYGNHPRERVSWYDAIAFCRWLSYKLTGKVPKIKKPLEWTVRLPTEQEWEKAARGTEALIFPYGNKFDVTKCNTNETGIGITNAVGIIPQGASPYGVMDMSGNVWEWTLTEYRSQQSTDLTNANPRVMRGGSWYHIAHYARTIARYDYFSNVRFNRFGFRVVMYP